MASSSTSNLSMSEIREYHTEERIMYTRMVRSLGLDPIKSMEIIAFWLWLEERGHAAVIHNMNTLDDATLLSVARPGLAFVEALRSDVPFDHPSHHFRRDAVQSIVHYLDNVCFKAFEDIRMEAEEDRLAHQLANTNLNANNNHGEGSSRGTNTYNSTRVPSVMEVERAIMLGYPFNTIVHRHVALVPMVRPYWGGAQMPADGYMNFGNNNNNIQQVVAPYNYVAVRPGYNIPREERTLFVTFSNGYPLTEHELYNFFMRHFGDVEIVTVQKTKGEKPPLFAHVTFYSLTTVLRILNGKMKVKFMTGGKHLWARRFYPKRNEDRKD